MTTNRYKTFETLGLMTCDVCGQTAKVRMREDDEYLCGDCFEDSLAGDFATTLCQADFFDENYVCKFLTDSGIDWLFNLLEPK